jgi:DNA ligase-3
VKKDYLADGAMADTADLVVLGAYYGTGSKGGLMSVFLMGVYDEANDVFRTVCKCGNGHDDSTIMKLQKELDMVKISKDYSKVPSWLVMNRSLTPDLIVADPKKAPVWEITGAEFSQSSTHTAGGISIRFPRVTRIRDDKDWSTATELERLKTLYKTSKESTDVAVPSTSSEHDNDVEMTAEPTAGQKRAKSQSSAVSLKKHKLAITSPTKEEKSLCKYGIKCYQTSKEHKEKYAHPLMVSDNSISLGCIDDVMFVRIKWTMIHTLL